MRRPALLSLLLAAITVAAYWPVRHAGFINFDDPVYVTNNENVFCGLTWHGLAWAFSTIHGSNWHPLTWLSHMFDCQMFGDKAAGHHLMNVGLHAANAVLLFLLLLQMTGAMWRSLFVGALFALHPLHVESVAWISERKDVLSTFFGLLTLVAYARYAREVNVQGSTFKVWYGLATLYFILGLLAKPMLVTLPFVMLLLDVWPLRRIYDSRFTIYEPDCKGGAPKRANVSAQTPNGGRKSHIGDLILEKVPFFALAATSSVVTFLAQRTGGAVVTMERMSLGDRFANAATSYLQYISKTFWPANLAAYYPFPATLPKTEVTLGLILLIVVTGATLALARRAPYFAVGWFWFVGTLVPVIGLVQVGSQAMADRYTYLPLVGLFVAVIWGVSDVTAGKRWRQGALAAAGATVLAACFVSTRVQAAYWNNSITLFSRAVHVTSDNALAQHNLGHALLHAGKPADAIVHFDESLRIKPGYPQAYFNRGDAYSLQGNVEKAMADYREAIHYQPDYEQAYYNLGKALALERRLDEARTNLLQALRWKPDYAEAETALGNVFVLEGDLSGGITHLSAAVRIRPDYDEGEYYLGAALVRREGFREAAEHLRTAIKLRPGYASALNDLGWLLATCPDTSVRNVAEAEQCAERACELTGDSDPMHLDTLAVAKSEAGQFAQSIALTEKAIGLAKAAGNTSVVEPLETHLNFYRKNLSYTQATGESAAATRH